tara:strand:- start:41 stop:247 length:207 start_codon:yes stop_codon:yes gene_type:complete
MKKTIDSLILDYQDDINEYSAIILNSINIREGISEKEEKRAYKLRAKLSVLKMVVRDLKMVVKDLKEL